MEPVRVVIEAQRVVAGLAARSTQSLDRAGVAARDLARYYALLGRECPGAVVSPAEACLIRDALPEFRAARREDPEATLALVVEKHARPDDVSVYEVDVPALVDRLRGLGPLALLAVVDLAERMDAAVRRGDFDGRERVRREFGIDA